MLVRPLALAFLLAGPATAQGRLLGVQSSFTAQELVRIDEATAAGFTVGPLGFKSDGLAFSLDGRLLAADNDLFQLVELNPLTASSTPVGSFNIGSDFMEGMAFHPVTGDLWGINVSTGTLLRIDDVTGNATVVGGFGGPLSMAAITWSADGSTLFAMDFGTGGLYTLDPGTGLATVVGFGEGGFGGPLGMAADPATGELYVAEWRNGADMTLAIVNPTTGGRTPVGTLVGYTQIEGLAFEGEGGGNGLGQPYCNPAAVNSTGASAVVRAFGSDVASDDNFLLVASDMPASQFGYFLASETQGFLPNAGGSAGNLCLALPIARFAQNVLNSGAGGTFFLQVDLTAIPTTPVAAVVAGDTWNFQAWYRDLNPGPTSNFTDAVSVTFN